MVQLFEVPFPGNVEYTLKVVFTRVMILLSVEYAVFTSVPLSQVSLLRRRSLHLRLAFHLCQNLVNQDSELIEGFYCRDSSLPWLRYALVPVLIIEFPFLLACLLNLLIGFPAYFLCGDTVFVLVCIVICYHEDLC